MQISHDALRVAVQPPLVQCDSASRIYTVYINGRSADLIINSSNVGKISDETRALVKFLSMEKSIQFGKLQKRRRFLNRLWHGI